MRTITGYVSGRPVWSENEPAHAKLTGWGGIPMSMALTSLTMTKGPKPKPKPEKPRFVRDRAFCGRWMPKVGAPCARNPGHRKECRSAALLERHRAAGL